MNSSPKSSPGAAPSDGAQDGSQAPASPVAATLPPPPARTVPWRLFLAHTVSVVLIQSSMNAAQFMLPYLAKRHYQADEWLVLLFTAAPLVLPGLSVFWQPAVRRLSPAAFLILFWLITYLPWAGAWFVTSVWQLAAIHVVSAIGYSAWAPVNGEYLSRLYPASIRGRLFGFMSMAILVAAGLAGLFFGSRLQADPELFRTVLLAGSLLTLVGIGLLIALHRHMPPSPPRGQAGSQGLFALVLEPLLHMRQILRADRVFFRYEAAYMTYGIGWMIVWVMLPLIGESKLKLDYVEYPKATSFPLQAVMAACVIPFGFINDRLGAARVSTLAFAVYTIFPIGLLLSRNALELGASCALWGVCSAAVQMGWTLGPVGLAPSPDRVSQYMAIHATLVGLRGALFQTVGVALLKLTDSYAPPLILASLGFAWAAWQMWSLEPAFAERLRGKASTQPEPSPGPAPGRTPPR
ncbi:MAG: MFS transporter [Phycisphaerales bacterium]